ncbi:holin [Pseudonocardia hispaniensis]|uniref:Holin n=1 Tax=Pseudonocardia hispaniensis TaxID=904933 RepID=A0ABW1J8V4_9PSEU
MLSAAFWVAALERAVKTAAQSLLSLWLVGDVAFNLLSIDWGTAAGVAAGAAVISLLTSIVSAPVRGDGTPSLVGEGAPRHAAP